MTTKTTKRFSPEVRERAVTLRLTGVCFTLRAGELMARG